MVMVAMVGSWTVDMLDALPDDGQRYEVIDGELFVTPAPGDANSVRRRPRPVLRRRGALTRV